MTETSNGTSQRSTAVIVLGLDENGKPKGGRFTAKQAKAAREAAAELEFAVYEITPDIKELANSIAEGRIGPDGECSLSAVKGPVFSKIATVRYGRPTRWDDIKVGDLVLVNVKLFEGWWEAVVIAIEENDLLMRWRDSPHEPTFHRPRTAVGLLPQIPAAIRNG
jgi:hypothetical protein